MKFLKALYLYFFGSNSSAEKINGGQGHYAETNMPNHYN